MVLKSHIGLIFIVCGMLLFMVGIYFYQGYAYNRRIYSSQTLLYSSWEKYKEQFILPEGRVIDYNDQERTSSEGQSYVLLRAVIIDDKETFDTVLTFTNDNMQLPNQLFGWKWGKKTDDSYGFLDNGGDNPAADADTDIALALILAYRRWNQATYLDQAKRILPALWEHETAVIQGKRYVIAGPWANTPDSIIINPSYFAPYAWEIFSQVDPERDWISLIDPAYELLDRVGYATFEDAAGVGLPPDWVELTHTGDVRKPQFEDLTTHYSFNAVRVPFRIALHLRWNNSERAKNYLKNAFTFLAKEWQRHGKLAGSYTHTGIPFIQEEHPIMYATILPYFIEMHPEIAKTIYEKKIIQLYSNDTNSFNEQIGYYERNWLWFAIAYMNNSFIPFL